MNEETSLAKTCYYYEMFMERAHGRYELPNPALQSCGMRNLIMAEKTIIISVDSVAHFEEQLIEIKKHMEDALDLYQNKPHIPEYMIDVLKDFKNEVVWAASSDEVMKIVLKTIDLTVSLPIDME